MPCVRKASRSRAISCSARSARSSACSARKRSYSANSSDDSIN